MQTLKKTGSRMPLRMKKAALVCSNYILHTFNPCGDVTVSYLLWGERKQASHYLAYVVPYVLERCNLMQP